MAAQRHFGEKRMKISELQEKQITDDLVDRILFADLACYDGQFADAAIVLGSSKAHLYRLPPAIEAYQRGNVKKIVTSGRTRKIDGQEINEGELLRDTALQMGVRGEDILVENKAANTWENISFSRALLAQKGLLTAGMTIAIATSSYHMRRSLCLAEKVFARDHLHLISFPGDDHSTRRDTWYTNEKGRNRCYGEVERIVGLVRQGIVDDWDF